MAQLLAAPVLEPPEVELLEVVDALELSEVVLAAGLVSVAAAAGLLSLELSLFFAPPLLL